MQSCRFTPKAVLKFIRVRRGNFERRGIRFAIKILSRHIQPLTPPRTPLAQESARHGVHICQRVWSEAHNIYSLPSKKRQQKNTYHLAFTCHLPLLKNNHHICYTCIQRRNGRQNIPIPFLGPQTHHENKQNRKYKQQGQLSSVLE